MNIPEGVRREDYLAVPMTERKRVALIAHDNCKLDLLDWARYNRGTLAQHELFATGTTGALIANDLALPVTRFLSGPLGGDQQIGAGIVEGRIDFVIFFWDPLEPHPHDVDVKALLRIAVVYNVPIACNRSDRRFPVVLSADAAPLRTSCRRARADGLLGGSGLVPGADKPRVRCLRQEPRFNEGSKHSTAERRIHTP